MSRPRTLLTSIFYALAGFTCWATGDVFIKLATETSTPKFEILFIGSLSGMFSILVISWLRGNLGKLRPRHPRSLAFLAVLFFASYVCWVLALPHLPLVNFYTIVFLTPMTVAILAALFLREPLEARKIAAIIAGFVGVLIAINTTRFFGGSHDWASEGIAFGGMLLLSLHMLTMRVLGNRESRECIAFYPRIGGILGGGAGLLIQGFAPMVGATSLYAMISGVVGGIGWMLMAEAYKNAPASTIAPFHYWEIVMGTILGYLVWHDIPTWNVGLGAAIIVASGLYLIAHARRSTALMKEESHI